VYRDKNFFLCRPSLPTVLVGYAVTDCDISLPRLSLSVPAGGGEAGRGNTLSFEYQWQQTKKNLSAPDARRGKENATKRTLSVPGGQVSRENK
jgi:hypothetical protein